MALVLGMEYRSCRWLGCCSFWLADPLSSLPVFSGQSVGIAACIAACMARIATAAITGIAPVSVHYPQTPSTLFTRLSEEGAAEHLSLRLSSARVLGVLHGTVSLRVR